METHVFFFVFRCTLPETNSSPLKMDGWKTRPSFWDGNFSGAMLVSGSVDVFFVQRLLD